MNTPLSHQEQLPCPAHRHVCLHTVSGLLRGKEGATQRPLSTLTRESLVEEVRTVVAWRRVTCELCSVRGQGLEPEFLQSAWVWLRATRAF